MRASGQPSYAPRAYLSIQLNGLVRGALGQAETVHGDSHAAWSTIQDMRIELWIVETSA